jgi:hypothetical protein
MKGLTVSIYKNDLGDCTLGGVSSKFNSLVLVDEQINAPFEVAENEVYLVIIRRQLFGETYLHLAPRVNGKDVKQSGFIGGMFGGNFAYCSDSRFSAISKRPLPIHDRFETQQFYNLND